MAKDINVNYNGQYSYSICIRSDFNDLIPMLNEKVKKSYDKVCIVTDSNVASHYLSDLLEIFKNNGDEVYSFSFEAGEASKTLDTVGFLYEHLITKKFMYFVFNKLVPIYRNKVRRKAKKKLKESNE